MNSKLFLCLTVIVLNLNAHARLIRHWSYAELQQTADVIVIGHPIEVTDLDETNSLGFSSVPTFQSRFRGVETTFAVSKVLKGDAGNDEIILHHYRQVLEWGSPPNGPTLTTFSPGDTNEYVLCLVKDGANRFAPAAGQVDARLSVKPEPSDIQQIKASPVVPGIKLKFVSVDSEETSAENGYGENATDGNPLTFWHTEWQATSPAPPHEIIFELPASMVIGAFTYLPRQDESDHGTIKDYEFCVSEDGEEFAEPIKKGTFAPGKCLKTETIEPVKCRFIMLRALSEVNGLPWASAAEIGVIPAAR